MAFDAQRGGSGIAVILTLGLFAAACDRADPTPSPRFADVTSAWGLPDVAPRVDGTYYLPEIMGAGLALFDADNDGDLDLVQAVFPPSGADGPAPNRFYERTEAGYREASEASGLGDPGYGQALAVGDIDGDGDLDLYVANDGADALYRNEGGGRFVEVAVGAGIAGDAWSTAATFCDFDGDGDLDLYVAHYVDYAFRGRCAEDAGVRDYCAPSYFDGATDTLYRNRGDGRFEDVSQAAGIGSGPRRGAKGLGVVCLDLTGDDRFDFLVANDGEMNQLWVQQPDGRFADEAIPRGVAVNRHGAPEASMGIAVGDVEGDGGLDLFLTHVTRETNTLYAGTPDGLFVDRTIEAGLAGRDLAFTGFGCALFDHDHDGDLDLAVANGRVYRGEVFTGATAGPFWNDYAEPNFFYDNSGDGTFAPADDLAAPFTGRIAVTRGLAVGDLDGDGDLDMATSGNDGALRIYRNDAPGDGTHWLQVAAIDRGVAASGARVTVSLSAETRVGVLLPGAGYQSVHQAVVHFGLGGAARFDGIEVRWADGYVESFPGGDADRVVQLVRGEGSPS